MMWVNDDISARGTTDIKTPLSQALRMLRNAPSRSDEIRLPLVFLLTDGEGVGDGVCARNGGGLLV
jgi:Mg-chelatase subunit ChlD